jgi:nucleotide-binding universal stress UspA family protein
MVRLAEETSRERSVRLLAVVEREAEQWGVEVTTATIAPNVAFLGEAAAVHARYFDYVLCGWEAGNPTSASTAEALIFGSGRPTILLPELSQVSIMDHLAIAWDGSRVAARAAFDAQHLLRLSGKVSVLTVVGEKPQDDADSAQRLARVLEQKGVAAEAVPVEFGGSDIGALLQERAVELGANLLVMGAFGHSRARDFILGGATQGILADLQLPVLLSH